MYRSREWLYERSRRDRRADPAVSAQASAQRYRVSRNTVAEALASPVPWKRKATAVASDAPFSEWDNTFTDPGLCAAIADRLTFDGTLIQTGTDSYRLKATENDYRSTRGS